MSKGKDGFLIQGYALDGHGEAISSVQVCLVPDNDGSTPLETLVKDSLRNASWTEADLRQEDKETDQKVWSWTLFNAHLPVMGDLKDRQLAAICRARTAVGHLQEALTEW